MEKETPRCTNPNCNNNRCIGCIAFAPKETPYDKLNRETDELETARLNRIDRGMYEASGGTPTVEEWESRFDANVPKSDDKLLGIVSDSKESEIYPFGYKHLDGDTIHTVTDWGNIKTFIRNLLTSHDAELRRKIEELPITELRGVNGISFNAYIRKDAVLALLDNKNV